MADRPSDMSRWRDSARGVNIIKFHRDSFFLREFCRIPLELSGCTRLVGIISLMCESIGDFYRSGDSFFVNGLEYCSESCHTVEGVV